MLCHCHKASALTGKIELDNIFAPSPRTFAPGGRFHTTRWCAGAPPLLLPSLNLLQVVCCISKNVKLSSSWGCGFLIRHCRLRKRKIRSSPSFSVIFFCKDLTGVGFDTLLMCVVLRIRDSDFRTPPLGCFEGN